MTLTATDEFFAEWKCWEKMHDANPSRVTISKSFLRRLEAEAGPWRGGPDPHIYGIPVKIRDDVKFHA